MNFQVYLPIAGIAANMLVLGGAGAAVGFLAGLFGVGGGFLITPLLIFLGIPTEVSIATGAYQAIATSISGAIAHWYRDNVDVKMGFYLIISGIVGSYFGVQIVAWMQKIGQFELVLSLSYVILLGSVGLLMLIESLATMRQSIKGTGGGVRRGSHHYWIHGMPLKTRFPKSKLYMSILPPISIGAFTGVLSAVMGVGGGFVLVPAMVYILKMRTMVAIGTSLMQITFISSSSTLMHAITNNSVDVVLGVLLIVGGVVGTRLGTAAGLALNAEQLRALMALLVLGVCIRMLVALVSTPDELFSIAPVLLGH